MHLRIEQGDAVVDTAAAASAKRGATATDREAKRPRLAHLTDEQREAAPTTPPEEGWAVKEARSNRLKNKLMKPYGEGTGKGSSSSTARLAVSKAGMPKPPSAPHPGLVRPPAGPEQYPAVQPGWIPPGMPGLGPPLPKPPDAAPQKSAGKGKGRKGSKKGT